VDETPKESSEGYAEEQPGEVAGDGESKRRDAGDGERDGSSSDAAGQGDEGTATGNPRSAG